MSNKHNLHTPLTPLTEEEYEITSSKKEYEITSSKKEIKSNNFSSKLFCNEECQTAMMKILFDFFNFLNDKKENQAESGYEVIGFTDSDGRFISNLPENPYGRYKYQIFFKYENIYISFMMNRVVQDEKYSNIISLSSNVETEISSKHFMKRIIDYALKSSNLKGSYFVLPAESLDWKIKNLEPKEYEDIFLPKEAMSDIKFFDELYKKKGIIMRYILAGAPGTCKTETTLVLANRLNKEGVTIIKTSVCSELLEKVELAKILAPSMLILDDIDLSVGSRKAGMYSKELGLLLDVLDGTDKIDKNLGIIATTNSIQLLDIAVSRPGRFHKILSFDSITKENIKRIILKSLTKNCNVDSDSDVAKIFTSNKVCNLLYDLKCTGSYVFHSIEMIHKQCEVMDKEITEKYIVDYINEETKSLEKIRKTDYLVDKFSNEEKKIGFGNGVYNADNGEDIECYGIGG